MPVYASRAQRIRCNLYRVRVSRRVELVDEADEHDAHPTRHRLRAVHELAAVEQAVALRAVDQGGDIERAAPPQLGPAVACVVAAAAITTAATAATALAALAALV